MKDRAESHLIADEEFCVHGTGTLIRVRVYSPTPRANGTLACSYEVLSDGVNEAFHIYGASPMQAVILTFSHVADHIEDLLQQSGGHIDSVIWEDLRRLRSSQEELEAARDELARQWKLK